MRLELELDSLHVIRRSQREENRIEIPRGDNGPLPFEAGPGDQLQRLAFQTRSFGTKQTTGLPKNSASLRLRMLPPLDSPTSRPERPPTLSRRTDVVFHEKRDV